MTDPLVTVITSTFRRPNLLLDRCIPSVQAQTYPSVEHVVVSDWPDVALANLFMKWAWDRSGMREGETPEALFIDADPLKMEVSGNGMVPVTLAQMDDWVPVANSGARARLRGLELARGDFIAYLDDDDSYRPEHCAILAQALIDNPGAGFAYSQMASHGAQVGPASGTIIGGSEPVACGIGTPMMMHRRELTDLASWGPPDSMEDWRLVARWLQRQVKYVFVPEVTIDVWPSTYRQTQDEKAG